MMKFLEHDKLINCFLDSFSLKMSTFSNFIGSHVIISLLDPAEIIILSKLFNILTDVIFDSHTRQIN